MATILLVDDHTTNRQLLKKLLGKTEHRFVEAADGAAALDIIRAESVDLVISDILMPKMDGYQFILTLHADPELAKPPVIFLTAAYLEEEARALALAFGVSHFMAKPVDVPVLLDMVKKLLAEPIEQRGAPRISDEKLVRQYLHLLANKLYRQVSALDRLNNELEQRVEERTKELRAANLALVTEVAMRCQAEESLRQANILLSDEAHHDALTGLCNRRHLERTLERSIFRCKHDHRTLGIMMIDIDHFKHYNDNFGHAAGDAVLVAVSRYLLSLVRVEDTLCRYGGEEILLVVQAQPETIWERAEVLRQGIQSLVIEWDGHRLPPITVSVGVALFPDHGQTGPELIQAADSALYRAKQLGRNRAMICIGQESSYDDDSVVADMP